MAQNFITNASYAKHPAVKALADHSRGINGISAFIVPTDALGFTVKSNYEKVGLHASNTTELILENVRVSKENLLGTEGNGFKQFLATLHGDYGYMKEYQVERFFRDAKLLEIDEGTSEVQRMVIGNNLTVNDFTRVFY